ncbi:aminoacyl-tRNA hydrolase [Vallitalea okinawensis]|uniref:aminoacyl-tRNA hydrolase n=1 Tax=Vallitalea okinawensis TaxID=2078660 RepID=UPI000CFA8C49|nr:aminoacyl-tRNA hydrolase [Vallitalea okinawensis]
MYLVVGLGNPGTQFAATRHNIGFDAVDYIAYKHNIDLSKKKYRAYVGQGMMNGQKVILMKPQTYMNNSGESIIQAVNFYKIPPENIIVIYDDTSLEIGRLRIRTKGSAGGHNGIKNLIAHLGGQVFGRVKVGVGEKPPGWDLADYVLGRFSEEELREHVGPALRTVNDAVETIINDGYLQAMNLFNQKKV